MKLIFWATVQTFRAAQILHKYFPQSLFVVLLVAAVWLKLHFIDYHSIWCDEAFTLWMALRPFKDTWHTLTTASGDAPLYFVLMNIYVKVFGIDNFAVRFLSILFSTAALGVLFYTSKKFVNLFFAVLVCLCFIGSSIYLHYSLEVRPYASAMLLSVCSVYFYLSLYKGTPKNASIIALGLCNALLFYTHFLTFLLVATEMLAAPFLFLKDRKKYIGLFYSLLLSGVLVFPLLKIAFENMPVAGKSWQQIPSPHALLIVFYQFAGNHVIFYINAAILLAALLFILLNYYDKKYNPKLFLFFVFIGFLPVLFAFLISYYTPVFVTRYFLFAGFGFYMAVAYAFCVLPFYMALKIPLASVYFWYLFSVINIGQFTNEDWKNTMPYIKQNRGANTITILETAYQENAFSYHYNTSIFKDYYNIRENLSAEKIFCINNGDPIPKLIATENPQKIILVQSQYHITDPQNTAQKVLEKYFTQTDLMDRLGVKVTVFRKL